MTLDDRSLYTYWNLGIDVLTIDSRSLYVNWNLGIDVLPIDSRALYVYWQIGQPGAEVFVPTLHRSIEITLDLVYDPNDPSQSYDVDGLGDRMDNKKLTRCQIEFPDGSIWEFSAYIVGYEVVENVDGALVSSVDLKITSVPTLM